MKRIVLGAASLFAATAALNHRTQSVAEISESALRNRLATFAADSMEGRLTGTRGLDRATRYLVAELTAAHVAPAGDDATYLQNVPIVRRQLDLAGAKASDNGWYIPGVDFLPLVGVFGLGTPDSATVLKRTYVPGGDRGGELGGPGLVSPDKVSGDFVVFLAPRRANGQPDYQLWNVRDQIVSYRKAGAIFVATLDLMPQSFIDKVAAPRLELRERVAMPPAIPPVIAMTRGTARKAVGSVTREVSYRTRESALEFPAHNVVAMITGSDPQLKSQYVVLSAHLDHLGIADAKERIERDSVFNGANAGSGAIALLAIAEQMAKQPVKPERSILFVWSTASAQGLLGAEFFTDKPPVPRDSIVASISLDRIGRATQLEITGARRLSSELGDIIDAVNARDELHVAATLASSAQEHVPNTACAGDEWHFARWGVPSVRFASTNDDDNRVSDDVSAIDFAAYARVTRFAAAIAEELANRTARVRIAVAKPDPRSICAR